MKKPVPPLSVRRSLAKLGEDIKTARLKRRISMSLLAERAFIGLSTLGKIQKGDAGVSIGNYASVIFSLGMGTPFEDFLDPGGDSAGLALEKDRLPKRVYEPRRAQKRKQP